MTTFTVDGFAAPPARATPSRCILQHIESGDAPFTATA